MAFELFAWSGHVDGVRAGKHEAVASLGVIEGKLLGDCTPLGVPEHRCGLYAQMIEQARQVSCQLPNRVRWWERPAPTVAAEVRNDHAVSCRELIDNSLEHLAIDHQPVHQQEG